MSAQGPGLRTAPVVVSGGFITVEVGTSAQTIEVNTGAPGETTSYPVGPDRTVRIPVPNVPGGTVLLISAGRGKRASYVLVEVIAP
jgi:hypothetical protein